MVKNPLVRRLRFGVNNARVDIIPSDNNKNFSYGKKSSNNGGDEMKSIINN